MKNVASMALVVVAVAAVPLPAHAQVESRMWDLPSLLGHALATRADLAAHDERIEAARYRYKEAKSHYFPRVHLTGMFTWTGSELGLDLSDYEITTRAETVARTEVTVPQPPPAPAVTVPVSAPVSADVRVRLPADIELLDDTYGSLAATVEQPLFTWGRIRSYTRAARCLGEVEQAMKRDASNRAAQQVREAFHGLLVARAAHAYAQRVRTELGIVRSLMARFAEEDPEKTEFPVTALDVLEMDGFLLEAKGAELKAQRLAKTALEYLALAAGLHGELTAANVAGTLTTRVALAAKDDYVRQSLASHPLMRAAEQGALAERHLSRAERVSQLPVVGLRGFYQSLGADDTAFEPTDYYGASLVVDMPVFDSGERRAKAAQHLARTRELEQKKAFLGQYLRTRVGVLHDEIVTLEDLLAIDTEAIELLDKRLKIALFGLKNREIAYRDYKDAFLARTLKQREYFERVREFYEKTDLLARTLGAPTALISEP